MRLKTLGDDAYCVGCGTDLSCPTGGSRVIGVEYQGVYDGVLEWRCPVCGRREGRFTGKELKDGEIPERPR